jgi:NTP pyrophosphatase (non-canonical NTP hydrolase)
MIAGLNDLAREIHLLCIEKGFYEHEFLGFHRNPSLPSEKIALIQSEASEMLDALRDGDTDAEALEAADVLIRLLDYCDWRDIDIEAAAAKKMAKNRDRPYLHGRQF